MTCWTDHTFRVNPAAKVFPNFKQKANPEFISQVLISGMQDDVKKLEMSGLKINPDFWLLVLFCFVLHDIYTKCII